MKFTLTGSLGNIGRPLAGILSRSNHDITIISSDVSRTKEIEAFGATAAIGSVSDAGFLTAAFHGADAVFTMIPPNWAVANYRQYIAETGNNYFQALQHSGVKRIVNLSSIGAHLPEGTGPIAGLYDVEQKINTLENVAVRHLRAAIFFVNFLFDISVIKNLGVMGNNYDETTGLVMVHPKDIAARVAHELETEFQGKTSDYVAGDERSIGEIVRVLGSSIGKPGLPWVQFSDEETYAGMISAGMSEAIAKIYLEMGHAIGNGKLFADFKAHRPDLSNKVKLETFAEEFAAAYNA